MMSTPSTNAPRLPARRSSTSRATRSTATGASAPATRRATRGGSRSGCARSRPSSGERSRHTAAAEREDPNRTSGGWASETAAGTLGCRLLRRIGLTLSDLLRNVAQRLSPSARRLLRDPYTVYTAWLIPILVAIGLVSPATDAGFAVLSGIGALIAQGVLSRVRRERWRAWQTRWSLLRLAVPVALVSLILYKGG